MTLWLWLVVVEVDNMSPGNTGPLSDNHFMKNTQLNMSKNSFILLKKQNRHNIIVNIPLHKQWIEFKFQYDINKFVSS